MTRLSTSSRPPHSLSESEFEMLSGMIETTLGISMPSLKRAMLETRLLRRIRQLGVPSLSAYCDYLKSPIGRSDETQTFLDLATTNKTSFFRELPQLEFRAESVFPTLLKRAHAERRVLRVWSAACSTGEEVWTLGILLDQAAKQHCPNADFFVLGSDVSGKVLKTAIAAKYDESDLAEIPSFAKSYFMRSKDRSLGVVRVHPDLRSRSGFLRQNLMDAKYHVPGLQDVVLIRNALIYFPRSRQGQIVARALEFLRSGGIFCVGLTETLHGFPLPVEHLGCSTYRLAEAP